MKIAFYMNVWEKTLPILTNGFLPNTLNLINYWFDEKIIIVNNVADKEFTEYTISKLYPTFKYYFANKNSKEVLQSFNLTEDDIKSNYYTAIPPFTALYHTSADYLFHIEEDCVIKKWNEKFIDNATFVMENSDLFINAMPDWTEDLRGGRGEALFEDDEFYYAQGFTEQMFLLKCKEFKKDIYHENNALSDRYPPQSFFEKKVDSYMRNHEKFRIVDKNSYYIHGEK